MRAYIALVSMSFFSVLSVVLNVTVISYHSFKLRCGIILVCMILTSVGFICIYTFVDISIGSIVSTTALISSFPTFMCIGGEEAIGTDSQNGGGIKWSKFGKFKQYKIIWSRANIVIPVLTHIGDAATDIGVLIDFYFAMQAGQRLYQWLFYVSIVVLTAYRILSAAIVFVFSDSIKLCVLQLFDIYIFAVLHQSWQSKFEQSGMVQNYISLLEATFESAPQFLITLYLIVADDNAPVLVYISALFSLVQLSHKAKKFDLRYFIEFDKKTEKCKKYLLEVCRTLWRICDIVHYFMFNALIWYFYHGGVVVGFLLFLFAVVLTLMWIARIQGYNAEYLMFNGILMTLPNPIWSEYLVDRLCFYIAIVKNGVVLIGVIVLYVAVYVKNSRENDSDYNYDPSKFQIFVVFTSILYLLSLCLWLVFSKYLVRARISVTPFISGCSNIDEVREIILFGYTITNPTVQNLSNWSRFPDPYELILFFEKEYPSVKLTELENGQGQTLVHWIAQNVKMGNRFNGDKKYYRRLTRKLKDGLKYDLNHQSKLGETPLMLAARYQPNDTFIQVLKDDFGAKTGIEDNQGRTWLDHKHAAKETKVNHKYGAHLMSVSSVTSMSAPRPPTVQ